MARVSCAICKTGVARLAVITAQNAVCGSLFAGVYV